MLFVVLVLLLVVLVALFFLGLLRWVVAVGIALLLHPFKLLILIVILVVILIIIGVAG